LKSCGKQFRFLSSLNVKPCRCLQHMHPKCRFGFFQAKRLYIPDNSVLITKGVRISRPNRSLALYTHTHIRVYLYIKHLNKMAPNFKNEVSFTTTHPPLLQQPFHGHVSKIHMFHLVHVNFPSEILINTVCQLTYIWSCRRAVLLILLNPLTLRPVPGSELTRVS
jgi:hypothetical protein